ncbi:MAG TPA: adenylate/guanylate cyclase domain-containing protein [Acidimicrobiales bacterium]
MGDQPTGVQETRELVLRRISTRNHRNIVLANVVGAGLAAISGALTSQHIKGQSGFGLGDFITLCVYLVASLLVGSWFFPRIATKATEWVMAGRGPNPAEQRRTLNLPVMYAAFSLVGWLGAAALWAGITAVGHPWGAVVRVTASILLGGFTTSALIYLLAESAFRPLVRLTLATRVPERTMVPGVRTRLIASWAVGADVFLLMIGLTFIGRPASEPPSAAAIWFIVGAGLASGTLVVYVAARSLALPMRNLRSAVSQVQRGQLDVTVDVDDAGELGLLQAGFNQMVSGLRERNALQDLFGRHVGDEVARQAVERGISLGGERREVGVLFVDILGSTTLSLRYPPDQVVSLLNEFFGAIIKVVSAEGGWVNKFEGDGALCVFGAPIAMEDCAMRALRAARTIRRELLTLAALHPDLDAAVGVSAGSVVAGNVGAEQRYEYTVIGIPVNEASRLTDQAKRRFSRVLASEEAIARSGRESKEWMVADEIELRGLEQRTLVYEPAAEVAARREAPAVGDAR